jgi:dolichol-phosphate mannosyltransferase
MLCVIIPAHNEEANIAYAVSAVRDCLKEHGIDFEMLFIDDGSTDGTFAAVLSEHDKDNHIKGLRFSRNFGKEAAIKAGLAHFDADCCVVMDCDLQHPAETVPQMYAKWQEGYAVVEGIKSGRGKESGLHRFLSHMFYGVFSNTSGIDMSGTSDFKLLDASVAKVIADLPERESFFRALTFWTGFKHCTVSYEVAPRKHGQTKWSMFKLAKYAVRNVTSFTAFPLYLISYLGVALLILFAILGIQTLVMFFTGAAATGFTTVILLLLFIGGCLMISLGIIGIYISKIFDEVKKRPQYIVAEEIK